MPAGKTSGGGSKPSMSIISFEDFIRPLGYSMSDERPSQASFNQAVTNKNQQKEAFYIEASQAWLNAQKEVLIEEATRVSHFVTQASQAQWTKRMGHIRQLEKWLIHLSVQPNEQSVDVVLRDQISKIQHRMNGFLIGGGGLSFLLTFGSLALSLALAQSGELLSLFSQSIGLISNGATAALIALVLAVVVAGIVLGAMHGFQLPKRSRTLALLQVQPDRIESQKLKQAYLSAVSKGHASALEYLNREYPEEIQRVFNIESLEQLYYDALFNEDANLMSHIEVTYPNQAQTVISSRGSSLYLKFMQEKNVLMMQHIEEVAPGWIPLMLKEGNYFLYQEAWANSSPEIRERMETLMQNRFSGNKEYILKSYLGLALRSPEAENLKEFEVYHEKVLGDQAAMVQEVINGDQVSSFDLGRLFNHYQSRFGFLGDKERLSLEERFPHDAEQYINREEECDVARYIKLIYDGDVKAMEAMEASSKEIKEVLLDSKRSIVFVEVAVAWFSLLPLIYLLKRQAIKDVSLGFWNSVRVTFQTCSDWTLLSELLVTLDQFYREHLNKMLFEERGCLFDAIYEKLTETDNIHLLKILDDCAKEAGHTFEPEWRSQICNEVIFSGSQEMFDHVFSNHGTRNTVLHYDRSYAIAAKKGDLPAMIAVEDSYLAGQFDASYSNAYCLASYEGHVHILNYLHKEHFHRSTGLTINLDKVHPSVLDYWLRIDFVPIESVHEAIAANVSLGQGVLKNFLSNSSCFHYISNHAGDNLRIEVAIEQFCHEKKEEIDYRMRMFQSDRKAVSFKMSSKEAQLCFRMLEYFINKRNSDDIPFMSTLMDILNANDLLVVNPLLYVDICPALNNHLVRLAHRIGNSQARDAFLNYSVVRDLLLVLLNDPSRVQYGSEAERARMEALTSNSENSMAPLSVAEKKLQADLRGAYSEALKRGDDQLIENLKTDLEALYKKDPALLKDEKPLPLTRDDFDSMDLKGRQKEEALVAYHTDATHTAIRFLLVPNPFMDSEANFVTRLESGSSYASFECVKRQIALAYLLATDGSLRAKDASKREEHLNVLADFLSELNRAHNKDKPRTSAPLDTVLIHRTEEADRPSCSMGMPQRVLASQKMLGQMVGHPLFAIRKNVVSVEQEFRKYIRHHFQEQFKKKDSGRVLSSAFTNLSDERDLDKLTHAERKMIESTNVNKLAIDTFIIILYLTHGDDFSAEQAASMREFFTLSSADDNLHILQHYTLADIGALMSQAGKADQQTPSDGGGGSKEADPATEMEPIRP